MAIHQQAQTSAGVTILFVDDEEMVVDIGSQMLEKLGYQVITARCGDEALEIYSRNRDRIDLVILDLVMPGIDGEETCNRLKGMNSAVKVLISSGYGANAGTGSITDGGCSGFLEKPFRMEQLSHTVRSIIH
jgi:two-component system, cell cycle sensor histidine kinase and response regulator CckA